MKAPHFLLTAFFAVLFLILIAALYGGSAFAHDWYEAACCSGQDCAPVPDGTVTETDHGVEVKGWGTMAESDSRLRWSQDDQDHLCIAKGGYMWSTRPKLMCVYRKRKFM